MNNTEIKLKLEEAFSCLKRETNKLLNEEYHQHSQFNVMRAKIISLQVFICNFPNCEYFDEYTMGWMDIPIPCLEHVIYDARNDQIKDYTYDLHALLLRLRCIDDSFREWNQPYYAHNPPEDGGTQINVID